MCVYSVVLHLWFCGRLVPLACRKLESIGYRTGSTFLIDLVELPANPLIFLDLVYMVTLVDRVPC